MESRKKFYKKHNFLIMSIISIPIMILIVFIIYSFSKEKKNTAAKKSSNIPHLLPDYYSRVSYWEGLNTFQDSCNIYTFYNQSKTEEKILYKNIDIDDSNSARENYCINGAFCAKNKYPSINIYTGQCYFKDQLPSQFYEHKCASDNKCTDLEGEKVSKGYIEKYSFNCNTPPSLCPGVLGAISLDYLAGGSRNCLEFGLDDNKPRLFNRTCNLDNINQRLLINRYNYDKINDNFVLDVQNRGVFAEIIYRDRDGKHMYLDIDENDKAIFKNLTYTDDKNSKRLDFNETVKWFLAPQEEITFSLGISNNKRCKYIPGGINSVTVSENVKFTSNPGEITISKSSSGGRAIIKLIPEDKDWSSGNFSVVVLDTGYGYKEEDEIHISFEYPGASPGSSSDWKYNINSVQKSFVVKEDIMVPDYPSYSIFNRNYVDCFQNTNIYSGSTRGIFSSGDPENKVNTVIVELLNFKNEVNLRNLYIEMTSGDQKGEVRKIVDYEFVFNPNYSSGRDYTEYSYMSLTVSPGWKGSNYPKYNDSYNIFIPCETIYPVRNYYSATNVSSGQIDEKLQFKPLNKLGSVIFDGTVDWTETNKQILYGVKYSSDYFKSLISTPVTFDCDYNTYGKSPPQMIYLSDNTLNVIKKNILDNTLSNIIRDFNISDYTNNGPFSGDANINLKSLQLKDDSYVYKEGDLIGGGKEGIVPSLGNFIPYSTFTYDKACNRSSPTEYNSQVWAQFIPFGNEYNIQNIDSRYKLPSFSSPV